MSLKLGYKQTEIGVIPDDWAPVKFGSICHRRRESGVPTAESFVIELEHIESGSGRLVGESSVQTMSSKRVFQEGDVLFGRLRSYLRKYLLAERDGFCSTEIWALVPENERVESGFLFQVVRLDGFITATGISYGTHMPRSDWSTIKEWPLSLPPPKEQKAIAEALSDVDALIDSLEALLIKKRNIKTGVMQELLTGRTRLSGFTGDWQIRKLKDVAELLSGGTPSTAVAAYWGGGIPWCTPTDITSTKGNFITSTEQTITAEGVKSSSATILPVGSILLCTRATIGEAKITTVAMTTNQGFKSLVVRAGVSNIFMYFLMSTKKRVLLERSSGSTFLEISKKELGSIDLWMPEFDEQKAIAAVLSDIDDEIEALEKRLAKTRDLKQGMAQELLTGRTRLV